MNATMKAQRAYSTASAPTRTSKDIEYDAMARITHKIRSSAQKGPTGYRSLVEALHDNRKLWDIFAVEVADANNPLPSDLKARLFYLAEFTRHHTSRVLAKQETVDALVEINTSVLRGMRGGDI
ncbi:flagellar biosynthesis regulator FlaF [Rhodobacteraceae bacterium M382]|nr:flagellar biosynthesis regulator FlaF [Rhodobacteraceae bacterium M382]